MMDGVVVQSVCFLTVLSIVLGVTYEQQQYQNYPQQNYMVQQYEAITCNDLLCGVDECCVRLTGLPNVWLFLKLLQVKLLVHDQRNVPKVQTVPRPPNAVPRCSTLRLPNLSLVMTACMAPIMVLALEAVMVIATAMTTAMGIAKQMKFPRSS
ncbi:uncharacterized protein LOC129926582 [Biomphalaria glabrata]|uniref:Uncharacterized protein LOC129926582 n=1 Tax=Biomphalaria glabrata TaxID=6526 RepID=A0A9W3AJJ3_BIOGL|nr:uncharacterized protein LOC129926582 [Biomphalaria glabrata]